MRCVRARLGLLRMLASAWVAWLAMPRAAAAQVMDEHAYSLLLFELFEYQLDGEANPLRLDAVGWAGGDVNRAWLVAEGEKATRSSDTELAAYLLYGRLISPFWDVVLGAGVDSRLERGPDAVRAQLALGLEGLAPLWFELEPLLLVSHRGDVSAQLTASYDLFLTQRLVAEPRLEVVAAVQEVEEFGVGTGLNSLELGLRFRYELRREVAPYIGVSWTRRFAGTARLSRQEGEEVSLVSAALGVRLWR